MSQYSSMNGSPGGSEINQVNLVGEPLRENAEQNQHHGNTDQDDPEGRCHFIQLRITVPEIHSLNDPEIIIDTDRCT